MKKSEIAKFIKDWRHKLYLNEWDLSVKIIKEDHHTGSSVMASINVDVPYLYGTVYIHPTFFKCSHKEQEHALIHELCHIFTTPLDRIAADLKEGVAHNSKHIEETNEQLTQRIANIFHQGFQK